MWCDKLTIIQWLCDKSTIIQWNTKGYLRKRKTHCVCLENCEFTIVLLWICRHINQSLKIGSSFVNPRVEWRGLTACARLFRKCEVKVLNKCEVIRFESLHIYERLSLHISISRALFRIHEREEASECREWVSNRAKSFICHEFVKSLSWPITLHSTGGFTNDVPINTATRCNTLQHAATHFHRPRVR